MKMTYIEFFERDAAENICACITHTPERVILIGDKKRLMESHAERYKSILADQGKSVEFICRSVTRNNLKDIIKALSEIIETYDDCAFDLTGGDELYLVAMGIVFERYKEKNIQMHRFNIRNGTILDCDQDGRTIMEGSLPELTVEENVRIYGGDIVYDRESGEATYIWDMNYEFTEDIDTMWDICKADVKYWNTRLNILEAVEKVGNLYSDERSTAASVRSVTEYLEEAGKKYIDISDFLKRLQQAGLVTEFKCDGDTIAVTYKNEQIKRCLVKQGQALEMKVFKAICDAEEKDGTLTYYDVMNGVHIDWDGDIHDNAQNDTENEVDVMMMRGLVPVFVSCKNGSVSMEELYKLSSVANKFGGKYAKKVLIATALGTNVYAESFRRRAKDMGIRLVEDIQSMSDEELNKEVRTFWSN